MARKQYNAIAMETRTQPRHTPVHSLTQHTRMLPAGAHRLDLALQCLCVRGGAWPVVVHRIVGGRVVVVALRLHSTHGLRWPTQREREAEERERERGRKRNREKERERDGEK